VPREKLDTLVQPAHKAHRAQLEQTAQLEQMVAKEDKVLVVSRVRLGQTVLQAHKAQLVITVLKEIQGPKVKLDLKANRVSKEKKEI
jgi:hypothetical protein